MALLLRGGQSVHPELASPPPGPEQRVPLVRRGHLVGARNLLSGDRPRPWRAVPGLEGGPRELTAGPTHPRGPAAGRTLPL